MIRRCWTLRPTDCSIRKSPVQSVFATPRSLSQLTTSFIVLRCQGIHRAPFRAWSCTSKNFRFEATSSVQFLLALKLNILVCLVFSISSVVKERKFATEPLSSFLCLFSNRLMVGVTGVGPVTSSLSGTRSNQLSYTPSSVLSSPMFGGGSRTRTGDIRLAKPTLYQLSYAPVETHSDAPGLAVAGGRGDTRQHFFLCGKSILNIWEMREASLAHPVSSGRALKSAATN